MNEHIILGDITNKLKILTELDRIDLAQNFYDVGGNSLTAIEFMSYLEKKYSLNITIKDLFEKSINDIVACIIQHEPIA